MGSEQPTLRKVALGEILDLSASLLTEAEEILKAGRTKKLRVRLGEKVLAEIPLGLTALGALGVALLAVALSRLTLEMAED
jgi:hypothetical protein